MHLASRLPLGAHLSDAGTDWKSPEGGFCQTPGDCEPLVSQDSKEILCRGIATRLAFSRRVGSLTTQGQPRAWGLWCYLLIDAVAPSWPTMATSSGIGSWPTSRLSSPGRRLELSPQVTLICLPAALLEWNLLSFGSQEGLLALQSAKCQPVALTRSSQRSTV